jgi:hypothetical protein
MLMMLGLVIRRRSGTQILNRASLYEPSLLKRFRVSAVGNVAPYFGVVLTITCFCQNQMDCPLKTSLSRLIHGKEMFSLADADEGHPLTILTSKMIFTTFRYR